MSEVSISLAKCIDYPIISVVNKILELRVLTISKIKDVNTL